MPTRERLDGFVATVVAGRFVEALRDFYHDDAVTRENGGPERRGLATLIAIEERTLRAFSMRTSEPDAVLLDGDRVAISWTFEMANAKGTTWRMEEVALQRWRGDRIAEERFFYDPDLPVISEAGAA